MGIAFVQAPEQGGGICLAESAEKGFECAIAQCTDSGALAEDCLKTNWCHPAGWSVDIFVQHNEGPHWHEVICGLPSQNAALATAEIACDKEERPYLIECSAVQLYDPMGMQIDP